jgi:site-specific DNA-methyltransferase (adenine-specific)
MGRCAVGFNNWEPIALYGKPPRAITDVIRAPIVTSENEGGHPCPKPLEWAAGQIAVLSNPCQVIIDPFMGSGTTLRAAKDLGRKAIGIEIEERYCEIAARRLDQTVLAL